MNIAQIVISLFVALFAITIHEASHGWAAAKMGDPTAESMGRVSLNPAAHIDLIGTILLPLILVIFHQPVFGWAKPVPVNPYNLRHPRRDNLWISLAGPGANLLAAGAALVLFLVLKNITLGLTGSAFLIKIVSGVGLILFLALEINISLAVFNLIPVPPLDGSGILSGLLSDEAAAAYDRLRPYGIIIIVVLVYTNVLNLLFAPIQRLLEILIR
jgi:Zn-dependent protease